MESEVKVLFFKMKDTRRHLKANENSSVERESGLGLEEKWAPKQHS